MDHHDNPWMDQESSWIQVAGVPCCIQICLFFWYDIHIQIINLLTAYSWNSFSHFIDQITRPTDYTNLNDICIFQCFISLVYYYQLWYRLSQFSGNKRMLRSNYLESHFHPYLQFWWLHQMETFSALLAFVRGIHRSPVNFLHKSQWHRAFMPLSESMLTSC